MKTRKRIGGRGLDSSGSGKGQITGFGKYGTEILSSIEYSEFLDKLSNY